MDSDACFKAESILASNTSPQLLSTLRANSVSSHKDENEVQLTHNESLSSLADSIDNSSFNRDQLNSHISINVTIRI